MREYHYIRTADFVGDGRRKGGREEERSLKDVSIHTNKELEDQLLGMVKEMPK